MVASSLSRSVFLAPKAERRMPRSRISPATLDQSQPVGLRLERIPTPWISSRAPRAGEEMAEEARSDNVGKRARHQNFGESESDAEPSQTVGEPLLASRDVA